MSISWPYARMILFIAISAPVCLSLANWNSATAGGLQQKLKQLTKNDAMIILDGDNIRGKTRFKLSKEGN